MSAIIRQSVLTPELPTEGQTKTYWFRLYGSAKSLTIANMSSVTNNPIVVITKDVLAAVNLVDELQHFILEPKQTPIKYFPDWETLPYDIFSPYQDILSERLKTLFELTNFSRGIVVAPITTLMHRLLPVSHLLANAFSLDLGQKINLEDFKNKLSRQGYNFVNHVTEHGEVCIRGSLVDIYPMGKNRPFRIDLFDNEIDSIRLFDPETQRSIEKVDSLCVLPAREISLSDENIALFRKNWRSYFQGNPNQYSIYRDVSQSIASAGIEYYLPLFYKETSTFFDYINNDSLLIFDEEVFISAELFMEDIISRHQQESENNERLILSPDKIFLDLDYLKSISKEFTQIHISNLKIDSDLDFIEYDSSMPVGIPVDAR